MSGPSGGGEERDRAPTASGEAKDTDGVARGDGG
jgi:hypothetical protein